MKTGRVELFHSLINPTDFIHREKSRTFMVYRDFIYCAIAICIQMHNEMRNETNYVSHRHAEVLWNAMCLTNCFMMTISSVIHLFLFSFSHLQSR